MDDGKEKDAGKLPEGASAKTPAPGPSCASGTSGDGGPSRPKTEDRKIAPGLRPGFDLDPGRRFRTDSQTSASGRRILRMIIAIALLVLLPVLLLVGYQNWKSDQEFKAKIGNVERSLKALDAAISSSSGYRRQSTVLAAIRWLDYAATLDPAGFARWDALRNAYFEKLDGGIPVAGADYVVKSAGIDMVYLPKGEFIMGAMKREYGRDDELPRRYVLIDYDFWIGREEMSNSQLRRIVPTFRSAKWSTYMLDMPDQPACSLDWHGACAWCERLNKAERKNIPDGYEYRLPTEAEWEYACRAGTETAFYWGNGFGAAGAEFANSLDKLAAQKLEWKPGPDMAPSDGYIVSAPCGSFKPNAFGLKDMSGNVWEWCYDWYNPNAYRELPAVSPVQLDPVVSRIKMKSYFDRRYLIDSTSKVLRGGSWGNLPFDLRSAARSSSVPEDKNTGIGFRVVLAPKIDRLKGRSKPAGGAQSQGQEPSENQPSR